MKFLALFLFGISTVTYSQSITGFENITDTDGNTHSLSTYLENDKYVLLNFYLETCFNCMTTAPLIESVYQNYGQNQCQLVVLSFIIDNQAPYPTNQDCDNWAINNGITGPPNFNHSEADWFQFYNNYGGGFAQTYLISPEGANVIYSHAGGVLNLNELELILNDLSVEINANIIQQDNTLEVVLDNNNNNYVFEWSTGQNSQQISPTEDGNYWVVISDLNNCFSDTINYYFEAEQSETTWNCNNDNSCIELSDGTGNYQSIEECEANCNATYIKENNFEVTIFPNPSNGLFTLNLNYYYEINAQLTITNFLGELVHEQYLNKSDGRNKFIINLKDKTGGIYILNLTSNKHSLKQKFVIQ